MKRMGMHPLAYKTPPAKWQGRRLQWPLPLAQWQGWQQQGQQLLPPPRRHRRALGTQRRAALTRTESTPTAAMALTITMEVTSA